MPYEEIREEGQYVSKYQFLKMQNEKKESKFKCNYIDCEKTFKHKINLTNHERIHVN
jgi:hypothetical protein